MDSVLYCRVHMDNMPFVPWIRYTVCCIVGVIWTICPYISESEAQCVVLTGEYGQFVLISPEPTHCVLYCLVIMDNLSL